MKTMRVDECLYLLPPVFHVADLTIRFRWCPRTAARRLFEWHARGKVARLGGRSGIYANLVRDKYPNWELALRMVMATGVIIGIEILRRAGWTTQIPYVPTVVVDAAQPFYQIQHFHVEALDFEWFTMMKDGIRPAEADSLRYLTPSWALADLIKREGWCDCGLGPDDIYWDMVTEQDQREWTAACVALNLGAIAMDPDAIFD
jgi:hypothetical protein